MSYRRELSAAVAGGLVVIAYQAMVVLSGRVDLHQYWKLLDFYLKGSLSLWAFIGLAYVFWRLYRERPVEGEAPGPFSVIGGIFRRRWAYDRCISMIWPPLLFALLMCSFNAFKQMILPAAGFGFDPVLADADRALFGGMDAWQVTHSLFPSPWFTVAIDRAYHAWFLPMAIGIVACAWLPASSYRLRTRYCLSYIAVWVVMGSILAFIFPAAGPCFYGDFTGGGDFDGLRQTLAAIEQATGSDLASLHNQAMLLKASSSEELIIGGGISAMPSVHNGLAVLFALAGYEIQPIAGMFLGVYAAFIWIGSIHLGWHYAIDGLVAAALVFLIWIVTGRVAEALDRDTEDEVREAAWA